MIFPKLANEYGQKIFEILNIWSVLNLTWTNSWHSDDDFFSAEFKQREKSKQNQKSKEKKKKEKKIKEKNKERN